MADHLHLLADEDLMPLVERGEAAAFEVVYQRHSRPAFALAYRICGSRAVAEDAMQEAFLSIWRGGGRYQRQRGSVRTWVLGVVHHRAIDVVRRHAVHDRRRAGDDGLAERLETPERTDVEAARNEDRREVRIALDTLPPEQQRVITLAYFGGFTHVEIAEMLELPVGTVKGRMRLGLEKLRDQLASRGATA
jgi:RNA polymerase sigma-70 factor (ECF subfamily)